MRSTRQALDYCYYCPNLCRDSCPVADAEQDEMATPHAKITTMRLLLDKKIPWSKEAALQAYKCSDCGQATEACELDNPVAPLLGQFKALAFKRRLAPPSVYQYCDRFKRRNNPYAVKLEQRLERLLPPQYLQPKGVTYFPGCVELAQQGEAVTATFELFDKLGIGDVGVFCKPMQCCGYPLLAAGDMKGFREHAEVMAHFLEEYPLLVSQAPTCLFTMREVYPAHGFKVVTQFLHVAEFLEPHVRQKNIHLAGKLATKVAYHDPCYLGRYLGIYDAPRQLIEMVCGEVLVELRRNREQTYCCGGGGLLPVSRSATAAIMAKHRLAEFEETGANTLVTACPTCVEQLRAYAGKVQVKGLVEFLNRAIETKGKVHVTES